MFTCSRYALKLNTVGVVDGATQKHLLSNLTTEFLFDWRHLDQGGTFESKRSIGSLSNNYFQDQTAIPHLTFIITCKQRQFQLIQNILCETNVCNKCKSTPDNTSGRAEAGTKSTIMWLIAVIFYSSLSQTF